MSAKVMNMKQAERWLERLKTENAQSYKDLTKILRRYEKSEDEHDCYLKMSHSLLAHPELTRDLNSYLEDANKFVINRPEDEKIKELMAYVKRQRPEIFQRIIQMIQELSKTKGENTLEISKSLKPRLKEIINGDPALEKITEQALDLSDEDIIARKNLEHLKMPKPAPPAPEQDREPTKPPSKPVERQRAEEKSENPRRESGGKASRVQIGVYANSSQEKAIMKQLQKAVEGETLGFILKTIQIYHLNIISRNEALELLSSLPLEEYFLEFLRDSVEAREGERRRHSRFKPLNDMNFSNCERASPSYVSMPPFYPIRCSGKSAATQLLTNDRWVSVPHGSEESENFSVRNKNLNEINLLKAEDERYEFDIYMKRLQLALRLLARIQEHPHDPLRETLIAKFVGLGILQILYKQCSREQREELEWLLRNHEAETFRNFREKLTAQMHELASIKEVHANKNWSEVAAKNFFKALDLKGFEFKKNEKDRMKPAAFVAELHERSRLLENGGEAKNAATTFEDRKEFFTVLNSFETSSRTERCNSRVLPGLPAFDLKDERQRKFYPLMVLAFEDEAACRQLYSLLTFFIDAISMNEQERLKLKLFLHQFLVGFLRWQPPLLKQLTPDYDEERLFAKIARTIDEEVDVSSWVTEHRQPDPPQSLSEEEAPKASMHVAEDGPACDFWQPAQTEEREVLYGSDHLYTLTRFLYAVYERLIKMREVAEGESVRVFELLFAACIKVREGVKFEEYLNLLFGKHAYLFSTLYKLFDSLVKAGSQAANCPLNAHSIRHSRRTAESFYLITLNRFCLANNLVNARLLRLTHSRPDRLLFLNYLESYYRSDELPKDLIKKRADIARGIDIYQVDPTELPRKKRKINEVLQRNHMEYSFEGSTIKMVSAPGEDLLLFAGRRPPLARAIKRELRRAFKCIAHTD